MSIGKRLRQSREAKDLKLDDLAGETGLSTPYLSRIERDEVFPARETLNSIVTTLIRESDLEEEDRRQLLDEWEKTELVERYGLDSGVADTAVKLNKPEPEIAHLREALERLDPDRRQLLYQALTELLGDWNGEDEVPADADSIHL